MLKRNYLVCLLLTTILVAGCAPRQRPAPRASASAVRALTATATTQPAPAASSTPTLIAPPDGLDDLSDADIAALASLRKVDDYPLYTMTYVGGISSAATEQHLPAASKGQANDWACSLFAALADPEGGLYGRNFDWYGSPALLLFTHPPDGYAAVTMVDMAYLDVPPEALQTLDEAPLGQRTGLLEAPYLPFDGMNARGLAVGMAAVPGTSMPNDPGKPTVDNLGIMREVLDHARTVAEAVAIFEQHNILMEEVPIHYLIADAQGRAAIIEFYQGEMVVIPNAQPYHLATNFLVAEAGVVEAGGHARYDRIDETLAGSGGRLSVAAALELLADVAQPNTQWSVVYGLHSGEVHVALGRDYEQVHTFRLEEGGQ